MIAARVILMGSIASVAPHQICLKRDVTLCRGRQVRRHAAAAVTLLKSDSKAWLMIKAIFFFLESSHPGKVAMTILHTFM